MTWFREDAPPMDYPNIEHTLIEDGVYGDTGKGKLADELSGDIDIAIRAVGGANAGHLIMVGTREKSLHLLPAACLREGPELFLGQGMVTNPEKLLQELDSVDAEFGTKPIDRLRIAEENFFAFEGHKVVDKAFEQRKGKDKVGTTLSGIGPAYMDKAGRFGMRYQQVLGDVGALKDSYMKLRNHWKGDYGVDIDSTTEQRDVAALEEAHKRLTKRNIVQTGTYWRQKFKQTLRLLTEGAQGSMLSIDSPGYPYVTSSATTTNGHLQGAGLPRNTPTKTIVVAKAYSTRVGEGPFTTRMEGPMEHQLQVEGREKGNTSGRLRLCGWWDAYQFMQQMFEEAADEVAIMKGDQFDGMGDVKVATSRDAENNPGYEIFAGWTGMHDVRIYDALPQNAQLFFGRIEELFRQNFGENAPKVKYIGTGPRRGQIIRR